MSTSDFLKVRVPSTDVLISESKIVCFFKLNTVIIVRGIYDLRWNKLQQKGFLHF